MEETALLINEGEPFAGPTLIKLYLYYTNIQYWHIHRINKGWKLYAEPESLLKYKNISCRLTRTAEQLTWDGWFSSVKFRLILNQTTLEGSIQTYESGRWLILHTLKGKVFELIPINDMKLYHDDEVYISKGKLGKRSTLSQKYRDYIYGLVPYEMPYRDRL